MKLKSSIRIIFSLFVCAAVGLFVFLRTHGVKHAVMEPPRQQMAPAPTTLAKPAVAFPSGRSRMVTVDRLSVHSTPGHLGDARRTGTVGPDPWSDVQIITDSKAGYREREAAIHRLPAKLSEADWEELKQFLLTRDKQDDGQLGQVLKNELMDALCALTPPPNDLGDVLGQIYRGQDQNEVLRDYAVQHLVAFDEQLEGRSGRTIPAERRAALSTLWDALNETSDSIAGTALLGLLRLSEEGVRINEDRLAQSALAMAGNELAGELTRITAWQVCARMNIAAALPAIESAASSSATPSMQISAIAALGQLGNANDLALLQNLGGNDRLNLPARSAINRIDQRLGLQPSTPQNGGNSPQNQPL